MPSTDVDVFDFSDLPALPDGTALTPAWQQLVQDPATGAVYRATLAQATAADHGAVPTVAVAAPDALVAGRPATLTATATAAAPATVARVEFYVGGAKVGQATASPFAFDWTPTDLDAGQRVLFAKAYDSAGNAATSAGVPAVVAPAPDAANLAPVVSLAVTPPAGVVGVPLAVEVLAADPDGSIARVELWNYGTLVAYLTAPPYVFSVTPVAAGMQFFTAKAYDNRNLPATTPGVAVSVAAASSGGGSPVTVPGAPTAVTGTAGDHQVSVTGTAPASTGGAAITGYTVYRNGGSTALATNVSLPYVDTTALNGTAYTYQLAAVNSAGEGPKSTASAAVTPAAASSATPLAAPAGGQASPSGQNALSITAGSVSGATGYKLYASATQNGTYAQVGGTLSTPSYTETGLGNAQTRWYQWVALGNGTTSSDSPQSAAFSGTTAAAPSSYDTPLPIVTTGVAVSGAGVTFSGTAGALLEFNAIAADGNLPIHTDLTLGGVAVAGLDFSPANLGRTFRYTAPDASQHLGTFQNTSTQALS